MNWPAIPTELTPEVVTNGIWLLIGLVIAAGIMHLVHVFRQRRRAKRFAEHAHYHVTTSDKSVRIAELQHHPDSKVILVPDGTEEAFEVGSRVGYTDRMNHAVLAFAGFEPDVIRRGMRRLGLTPGYEWGQRMPEKGKPILFVRRWLTAPSGATALPSARAGTRLEETTGA